MPDDQALLGLEYVATDPVVQRNFEAIARMRLAAGPAQARVFNSGALSINNATPTVTTFDSERWDNGDLHSTSANTGRLTAPVTGLYVVGASVSFASNGTGYREVRLRLNGTTSIAIDTRAAITGQPTRVVISTEYRLAAGDYVEVVVEQTSGGALNVEASGNWSPEAWAHRIGSYS